MRIFRSKPFKKWAEQEGLTDSDLCKVVAEMHAGLLGSNLGGNLFKKRIAIGGRGKSSGLRTMIAYKIDDKAFFLVGFAKNERDNIDKEELVALKLFAKELLKYSDAQIQIAIATKEWYELICASKKVEVEKHDK